MLATPDANRTLCGVFAFAMLACGCAPAADVSGRATVVDGDSLEMGSASIRIFGIDAPEGRQTCAREGRSWACGETAARELRALVGDHTLRCSQRDIDNYYTSEQWATLFFAGLVQGSIYALIALGYTLVYGILLMINFAHGEVFMAGAFTAAFLANAFKASGFLDAQPLIAIILLILLAAAVSTFVALVLERIAYRPLRGAPRLAPLISALGMSIFLQNYVQILQGARVKPIQPVITGGFELMRQSDFVVRLSYLQLGIIVLTVVLD
jgi:hypothetical protein